MGNLRDYSVKASGFIGVTAGVQQVAAIVGPVLHGVYIISNGTNASTITVYHGTAATAGNELVQLSIPATTVPPQTVIFHNPIACPDGIFVVTTGVGSNSIIYYSVGA